MTTVSHEDATTALLWFHTAWAEAFRVYRESRQAGLEPAVDEAAVTRRLPQVAELMAAHDHRLELLVAMTSSPDWAVRDACATLGITDLAEASAYVATSGRHKHVGGGRQRTETAERASATAVGGPQ